MTNILKSFIKSNALYGLLLTILLGAMPLVAHPQDTSAGSVNVSGGGKCGVNTFVVNNECGLNAFQNAYWQCHDGYEVKEGGDSSCKTSETWQKYAVEACQNRCAGATIPNPVSIKPVPVPTAINAVPVSTTAVPTCYINEGLFKEYNELISRLRDAEKEGNKDLVAGLTEKMTALKTEIAKSQKACDTITPSTSNKTPTVQSEPARPTTLPAQPTVVAVDRCKETEQWENKITYYKKLDVLGEAELKNETGFSQEEVKKILVELQDGLGRLNNECKNPTTTTKLVNPPTVTGGGTVPANELPDIIKPVAAESGHEVDLYYRAKIGNIMAGGNADEQVLKLKNLGEEINNLIVQLIKSKKEINAAEIGNLVEIKVGPKEIRANDIPVQTTSKKVMVDIGTEQLSVEPGENQVIIKNRNIDTTTKGVSIKENALMVGNSAVNLSPSGAVEKLGVAAKSVELKEENSKAVYKITVSEPRRLLWILPVNVEKKVTVDASSLEGNVIGEKLPWWNFLTAK